MKRLLFLPVLLLSLLVGNSASPADFRKGMNAYRSGDYATALREWKPLAKQGKARAQTNLGQMYHKGKGVSQNYETAVKWYTLAAEQGNVDAQTNMGFMYETGQGVPQNDKTAVKWYTLAAEQRDAYAQNMLGWLYSNGQGVPQNHKTAVKWWRLAAEQGYAGAQSNLGVMYREGKGVTKNDKTAFKWYRLAAEQGFATAQNSLGVMYREGKGVPQNDKTAVKWYTLAAEQGHAVAQFNLGLMYANGQGVPHNYETALTWYRLAAEQGNADAQTSLGSMYVNGQGVLQNYKTAVKWFKLAAEQGYASAQSNLGVMYREGKGVTKDYDTALKWYRLSAEQGHPLAQVNLGWMYYNGEGVSQNYGTATKWIKRAAEQGDDRAKIHLSVLQETIAPLEKETKLKPAKQVAKKTNPKVDQQKRLELARRTQEALQVLGLYFGKLDGIIGVKTRSAIQGWQKHNGYSATGEITETQLTRLEQEAITRLAKKETEPKRKPKKIVKKKTEPQPPSKTATSESGFFVSKLGHVITNQHVVSDCGKVTIGDDAKKQVTADVLETDRRNDLALLRISSTKMASADTKSLISKLDIKTVSLASEGLLRVKDVELGERVLVAGYPYGDIFSSTIKVTGGMVSATRGVGDDSGQFQIDAAVQPGSSGGPIYDENGNIVGVVIAQLNKMKFAKTVGSLPENVNFGIKTSTVKQFLNSAGLPTKWSERSKSMTTRDLAKIAENQTVMVVCHP